jgi:hypothetical protein
MTAEAQQIAIAKVIVGPNLCRCGLHWLQSDKITCGNAVSDYLNDLNAMHEAEKILGQGQRRGYIFNLQTVCGGRQFGDNYFATAAQRAEALLRTLDLWKEAKG